MMQCVANGHEIAAIANLKPPSNSGKGTKERYLNFSFILFKKGC
jgi:diphthine-ammonia ligase